MSKKNKIIIFIFSIVIVLILITIVCPMILNSVEESKYTSFNSSRDKILESAKNKYSADINNISNTVTEYTVKELIDSGYIDKNTINPLTGKKYDDDTKVMLSNENGKIKIYYINGDTLLEIVKKLNEESGIYIENNEYIYKGSKSKNYISFNQSIYRIVKVDKMGYSYIINNDCSKNVHKNKINTNLSTVYNDKYDEYMKKMMSSKINMITKKIYDDSYDKSDTYIESNNNMWIKDGNNYLILDNITGETLKTNTDQYACMKYIIKLKNNIVIEKGDGTQLNPYIINMKNY